MGYSLSDLRTLSRQFVRNANDSSMYPDTAVDNALMMAGEEWCRLVKPRTLGTITLTAGSSFIATVPADWLPELQRAATVVDVASTGFVTPDIHFADYNDVLRSYREVNAILSNSTANATAASFTGKPCLFGFPANSTSGGIVSPIPDQPYPILVWYEVPFPTWTAGGTQANFSTMTDAALRIIATNGVEWKLHEHEPENMAIAEQARQRFTEEMWRFKSRDTGGRGGQISYRDDPDMRHDRPRFIRA